MITDFGTTFDSYRSAYDDLRLYHEAKGYLSEGDRYYWQPQDWTDLEPETVNIAPGAMTVGELEDYDGTDCDEF